MILILTVNLRKFIEFKLICQNVFVLKDLKIVFYFWLSILQLSKNYRQERTGHRDRYREN